MTLPKLGDNRTILLAIVASAVPLTVIVWGIVVLLGKTIDAKDVALVIMAIGGPVGYLAGRSRPNDQ